MLSDLFPALVRGAHYASVVSSFGCFAFLLAVARPAWRATGGAAEGAGLLDHFLLRLDLLLQQVDLLFQLIVLSDRGQHGLMLQPESVNGRL